MEGLAVEVDGVNGIDNTFGNSFFPVLSLGAPGIDTDLIATQAQGIGAVLLLITDWNGERDDSRVTVTVTQTVFGTPAGPSGEEPDVTIMGSNVFLPDGTTPAPLPEWEVKKKPAPLPDWDESRVTDSDEEVVVSHNWLELRRFMWDYVGIVRSCKRLQRALNRVEVLQREILEYYSNYRVSSDFLELRNLAIVAKLIIRSAMSRRESRGLHYNIDYPTTSPIARDTILVPTNFAAQDVRLD